MSRRNPSRRLKASKTHTCRQVHSGADVQHCLAWADLSQTVPCLCWENDLVTVTFEMATVQKSFILKPPFFTEQENTARKCRIGYAISLLTLDMDLPSSTSISLSMLLLSYGFATRVCPLLVDVLTFARLSL